jgi:hypothetical protein
MVNDCSIQHWRGKAPVIAVFLGIMVLTTVAFAQGAATIRPIEDFVDQQGTFCFPFPFPLPPPFCLLFVPPIENFIGASDPDKLRLASVDYAGLANDWIEDESGGAVSFGTEMSGTVIERPLADGRAEVHVILKTKNALTWVVDDPDQTFDFNGPLLFGNRAPDVLNEGKEPALGDSFLEVKFINTAPGAPLPDLIQLLVFPEEGQEQMFFALRARARGELHELFGVLEGTPGRATVVQTGLFMKDDFKGAVEDNFPVERIDLKVVGK